MHLKKTLLPILTFALVLAWYGMEAKSKFKDTLRRDSRRARYSTKKILKRRNKSEKPNIVLILTDDQDKLLGSMNVMPKTRKILEALGADFNNSFVNTPMCCPSRSTLLTGLYTHNHHVYTNNNNCSSLYWQQTHEPRSFANYLSNVGYRTGFFGKYLNEYNGTYIPPGWREWVGLIRNSKFYNYTINFNGNKIKHYDNYYKDYLTDLIANDSVTFLKQSKQYFSNRPVLMVLSVPAPHGPEDSAPQYQHLFENNTMHRTPTWNVAPNLDKQWLLKTLDPMEPITKRFTDILHQKRLQTLQSVDDLVEKVHNELRDLDELDNTFIIYTSDHGYHLGQFGVIKGKALPYDFDVRVPLYIRGPGIRPKTKISNIISHVDIAPTILDMAGVDIPEHMDGESILRLTKAAKDINNVDENGFVSCKKPWRDTVIVERGKVTSKKAMQLKRQHKKDFQNNLEVVGMIPEAMKQYLSPKLRRIWMACSNPDSQTPCSGDQKWECRKENGRYRIYKCRGIGDTGKTRVQRDVPFLSQECPCDQERWKLSRQEKRNQRKFLRSHLGDRDFKPKFMRSKRSYLRTLNYSHDTFDLVDQSGTESPAFDVFDRRCRVLPNNTMTCDIQLYEDASEWKNHKTKLDDMIEEYQKMLDDLRHIRKHLKKSKPRKSYLSEIDNNESGPGFYTDDFNIDDGLEPDGEAVPCDCEEEEQLEQNEDDSTEAYYNIRKKGWTRKKNKPWRRRYSRKSCNAPDMNCFSHNNDHWKTPPLWPYGYFCFCTNSNNNTYWCLRTINATHNFLYCEFITNFISYYDFTVDPFQMKNKVHELNYGVLHQLRDELFRLRRCSGSRECYSRAGSRAYRRRQKDNNISDISADDINLNYDYSDYGVS